jgi:hypothetical protein
VCFDLSEVAERPGQSFGKIEQGIAAGTEGAQRQPCRRLATQARDDAGLEKRRLACAGCAENHERPPLGAGTHSAQRFEGFRDFAAATIEQRGVRIVIAERGKTGERRRAQLEVDRKGLGVEPDAGERSRFSQPGRQALGDISLGAEIECASRRKARREIDALIMRGDPGEPFLGLVAPARPVGEQEKRDNALSHIEAGLELAKTFVGFEPVFRDDAENHPTVSGGGLQSLVPGIAARDAVIDEHVREAAGAQPSFERRGELTILAGMAHEQNSHWKPQKSLLQYQTGPKSMFVRSRAHKCRTRSQPRDK